MFLERALVGSSLRGVLTVDKGIVFLAILRTVGKGYLNVFARQVHNGIQSRRSHVVVQQVFQSVTAHNAVSVIIDGKARI